MSIIAEQSNDNAQVISFMLGIISVPLFLLIVAWIVYYFSERSDKKRIRNQLVPVGDFNLTLEDVADKFPIGTIWYSRLHDDYFKVVSHEIRRPWAAAPVSINVYGKRLKKSQSQEMFRRDNRIKTQPWR